MHLKKILLLLLMIFGYLYFASEKNPESSDEIESIEIASEKANSQEPEVAGSPISSTNPHTIIEDERYELAKEELENFSRDLHEIQQVKRQGPTYIELNKSPYELEKEYYEGLD
jgi:hypothetical protein